MKNKLDNSKESGIVFYIDIFPFSDVVEILREQYGLSATDEEVRVGNKFSFALYFDKELRLNADMTFLTLSDYIRKEKIVPREKDFTKHEEDYKKKSQSYFIALKIWMR